MRLSLLLQALRFLRTPPAELPRLIDQGCRKKFRRVELADCEAVKPCLLAAGQALNLSAPHVPELDVNAVGAALAQKQNSHSRRVYRAWRRKGKCDGYGERRFETGVDL